MNVICYFKDCDNEVDTDTAMEWGTGYACEDCLERIGDE